MAKIKALILHPHDIHLNKKNTLTMFATSTLSITSTNN